MNLIEKIISGGQTGVDRAALDFAIANGILHGGWCPAGRLAVDGVLLSKYRLQETESSGCRQRTKMNVCDSDGTLILNCGELSDGTLQTRKFAEQLGKPHLVIQLESNGWAENATRLNDWISSSQIHALNVAGPREEKRPGIYDLAMKFLVHWHGWSLTA